MHKGKLTNVNPPRITTEPEDPETGQTYSRDWNLVASGTRITAEFGAFLKALLRQSCG